MIRLVCDFCSSPHVEWSYPARNFVCDMDPSSPWLNESVGAWAACATCHDLIEAEDYMALAIRATMTFFEANPELPRSKEIFTHMRELHAQFREARTGPPTQVAN